jgi:molybdopterin/thiamine biosynthesis adenylyltransferase
MSLDHDERYSRQILFRGIGVEGQKRLAAARVAVVGCGATGSAVSSLLARAGVGIIRIVDRDYVEPSNLQGNRCSMKRTRASLCRKPSRLRAELQTSIRRL